MTLREAFTAGKAARTSDLSCSLNCRSFFGSSDSSGKQKRGKADLKGRHVILASFFLFPDFQNQNNSEESHIKKW